MRSCRNLKLTVLLIYNLDICPRSIPVASVHFAQVCANVSPAIQLQLCCRRSDGEVYSGTGMANLKKREALSMGLLSNKNLSKKRKKFHRRKSSVENFTPANINRYLAATNYLWLDICSSSAWMHHNLQIVSSVENPLLSDLMRNWASPSRRSLTNT